MTKSDLDDLRQFGQMVRTKHAPPNKKRFLPKKKAWLDVFHLLSNVKKRLFSYIGGLKKWMLQRFHLYLIRMQLKRINRSSHFPSIDRSLKTDGGKSVLVEYQKQLGDLSIIIRRRKKKDNTSFYYHPLGTGSSGVAYYFHRIDVEQEKCKTNFSPRSSIYDFHYQKKGGFWVRIFDFFR